MYITTEVCEKVTEPIEVLDSSRVGFDIELEGLAEFRLFYYVFFCGMGDKRKEREGGRLEAAKECAASVWLCFRSKKLRKGLEER